MHEIGSKRLNSSLFPTHLVSRLPCQEHDHEEEEMADSSPSKAHQEAVPVKPEPTPEEKEPQFSNPKPKCDFPTGILGGPNVIYRHMPVVYMLFFNMYCMCISIIYIYIYIHT